MARKVQVVFELDVDHVKSLIKKRTSATKQLTRSELANIGKEGPIRASEILTRTEVDNVLTLVGKLRQFPDYAPTMITKVAKLFVAPNIDPRHFIKQQVMFRADMHSSAGTMRRGRKAGPKS